MSDWQNGIGRLNPNAPVNFSFKNNFSIFCDNLQLFKALGIYDQVERDVLRGFESAKCKYWGIPNATEGNGYFNRTERPVVTVISEVHTEGSDLGKSIVLQNAGKEPITQEIEISTSRTSFEETVIDVSATMEFNQNTSIAVEAESSKFSTLFSAKTGKQVTKNYSEKTTTSFTISSGEQLVKIKNLTQITQFKVRVTGKFCLNCDPRFNGHYLWMPLIDRVYECQVVTKDIGTTTWRVERIAPELMLADCDASA